MRSDGETAAVVPTAAGFQPLAVMLQSVSPAKLNAARSRVATFDRDELLQKFQDAFASGKRLAAFVLADELTTRGVPPAFRLAPLTGTDCSINQRFDLMLADLRWLRSTYPMHARIVRYKRCKALLTGSDAVFFREAEYAFYAGRRPAWKIVGSLSLTLAQQWDCVWLRSTAVTKHHTATQACRDRVFKALQDDMRDVRRTVAFTDDDARTALLRRHALWLCARMTSASPSDTALRYSQMTGHEISRQAVAKQLEKIREILRKQELTL